MMNQSPLFPLRADSPIAGARCVALGLVLVLVATSVEPAVAAPPATISLASANRGIVETNTAAVAEGELLDRLASLRVRCVGAKPTQRGTLISDLGQRFLARRVETDGELRFVGSAEITPTALAKQTGEFHFCGAAVPPMPSWEGIRSAARILSQKLGLALEKPLLRVDAVRVVDEKNLFTYHLVSEEAPFRQAVAGLAPGTPLRAELAITSIDENDIHGVLIRLEQTGEAPPAGSWTSPQLAGGGPPPPPPAPVTRDRMNWGALALRNPAATSETASPPRSGPFQIKLHETFELRPGETARLGPQSPIEIRFAHVKDKTECDADGNCKRGPADIHLQLVAQTGQKGDVIFESPMRDPIELPLAGFRLRVLRLEPRPELHGPLPESAYHAELVLDLGKPESKPPKKPAVYVPRQDDIWYWWAMILGEILSEEMDNY